MRFEISMVFLWFLLDGVAVFGCGNGFFFIFGIFGFVGVLCEGVYFFDEGRVRSYFLRRGTKLFYLFSDAKFTEECRRADLISCGECIPQTCGKGVRGVGVNTSYCCSINT